MEGHKGVALLRDLPDCFAALAMTGGLLGSGDGCSCGRGALSCFGICRIASLRSQ
ncbi:MAG: hypothetical protein LBT00_01670 [Spirochaetaceae bacterium]|nr:hypothetical protein [Spirochaetaceae bacterium]